MCLCGWYRYLQPSKKYFIVKCFFCSTFTYIYICCYMNQTDSHFSLWHCNLMSNAFNISSLRKWTSRIKKISAIFIYKLKANVVSLWWWCADKSRMRIIKTHSLVYIDIYSRLNPAKLLDELTVSLPHQNFNIELAKGKTG